MERVAPDLDTKRHCKKEIEFISMRNSASRLLFLIPALMFIFVGAYVLLFSIPVLVLAVAFTTLQKAPRQCIDIYIENASIGITNTIMAVVLQSIGYFFPRIHVPNHVGGVLYAWSFLWFAWGLALLITSTECTGMWYYACMFVAVVMHGGLVLLILVQRVVDNAQ